MSTHSYTRPSLESALSSWTDCLSKHALPVKSRWIFAENLCIERLSAMPGSFHLGFQTKFTSPDEDSLEIAYDHFCETKARMVFYRLGSANNQSVCMLLCDSWFEKKTALDGFERRDEWNISFRPGKPGEIEEISDLTRWVRRIKNDHTLHDFYFGMALETVDEIRFHGRPLMPYERMAQRMLNRLRRIIGQTV